MNDFLQTKCEKCQKWHARALSCVSIALQEQARDAFDEWFYSMYAEMRKRELMYLDVVHDKNEVVIFNLTTGHLVNILTSMTEEAQELYTVTRGQNLKRYTVLEYLDAWDRQEIG
jgi:hypothetical protein